MNFKVIMLSLILFVMIAGCGVTVSTSGMKVGFDDKKKVVSTNGVEMTSEEFIGLQIKWAPAFTWRDVYDLVFE